MIKLIWISEKDFKGITFWFLKKVSDVKILNEINGFEAEKLLEKESADFLYLNLKRPANTDAMQRLCLRNINGLRVSVFTFRPYKSRILKIIFPPEIIKTIAYNLLMDHSGKYLSSH